MRPELIEAVLFDFDGVVADTEPLVSAQDLEAFRTFGIEPTWDELYSFVGTDGYGPARAVFEKYGVDATFEDLRSPERHADRIEVYLDPSLDAMPGIREFIPGLRAAGVRTALVSTSPAQHLLAGLNRLGMTSCFDAIVSGDLTEKHKPDPEPYAKACELLGVDPARAVAFDDSPSGIASAKAAGCYAIGFTGSVVKQDTSAADETVATFEGLTLV